jgi:intracellular multiplication protein IcmC
MQAYRLLIFLFLTLFFDNALATPSENMVQMMQTFQRNLGPLYHLIVAISYVLGIWFIADSIFRLKKYGQQRTMMSTNASLAKPVILLVIGLALLYFPAFVNISIESLWAYGSSDSPLKYPIELSAWSGFVNPLIDSIRLFGLIAVVRGLVLLTRLANESPQPGSVGKGIMHIAAGTLAINIIGTINVIKATFGFS